MAVSTQPRKRYRPRPLVDPVRRAITGVRTLDARDASGQIAIARRALAELGRGIDVDLHWRSLADTANMAESLVRIGIGAGPEAARIVRQAQQALADIHGRMQRSSSRALYSTEVDALHWLIQLHQVQLGACSYAEFDEAFRSTERRIAQARAGNAPRGAIVVEGEIVGCAPHTRAPIRP